MAAARTTGISSLIAVGRGWSLEHHFKEKHFKPHNPMHLRHLRILMALQIVFADSAELKSHSTYPWKSTTTRRLLLLVHLSIYGAMTIFHFAAWHTDDGEMACLAELLLWQIGVSLPTKLCKSLLVNDLVLMHDWSFLQSCWTFSWGKHSCRAKLKVTFIRVMFLAKMILELKAVEAFTRESVSPL